MSTTVKHFHSDMPGAPVLSGTAGALLGVLDACLVNGWGAAAVDSITIAGGVATVTRAAGHPFEPDMVAEIAGATVTGGSINGLQKVLSATGTSWTFDATGITSQTATGSPTQKVAALGWTKPFSGTNLGAYRAPDVDGTRFFLRVDDTGTNNARTVGYETMSDVNTGTGLFPTNGQASGGLHWTKSSAASAAARRWTLVGNGKVFYLVVNWQDNTSTPQSFVAGFGDVLPEGGTDAYRGFLHGSNTSLHGNAAGFNSVDFDTCTNANATYFARAYHGIGGPVGLLRFLPGGAEGQRSGGVAAPHVAFPNGSNVGLYASQFLAMESATYQLRGKVAGVYGFPQRIGGSVFGHRERVAPVAGLAGRRLMVLNSGNGCWGFDITGPWA